jgi:hypothetical protein
MNVHWLEGPLHVKLCFIWTRGFRVKDFKKSTNQKQELAMVAIFVKGIGTISSFHHDWTKLHGHYWQFLFLIG